MTALTDAERRTLVLAASFSAVTVVAAFLYVRSQTRRPETPARGSERLRRAESSAKPSSPFEGDNVPRFDSALACPHPPPVGPPAVCASPLCASCCARTLLADARCPFCAIHRHRLLYWLSVAPDRLNIVLARDGCGATAHPQPQRTARPWVCCRTSRTVPMMRSAHSAAAAAQAEVWLMWACITPVTSPPSVVVEAAW